jgi:hypothetical protein
MTVGVGSRHSHAPSLRRWGVSGSRLPTTVSPIQGGRIRIRPRSSCLLSLMRPTSKYRLPLLAENCPPASSHGCRPRLRTPRSARFERSAGSRGGGAGRLDPRRIPALAEVGQLAWTNTLRNRKGSWSGRDLPGSCAGEPVARKFRCVAGIKEEGEGAGSVRAQGREQPFLALTPFAANGGYAPAPSADLPSLPPFDASG